MLEALAIRGAQPFADTDKLTILRRETAGGGPFKRIPINYDTFAAGEQMAQNIVVLAGDNIVVP